MDTQSRDLPLSIRGMSCGHCVGAVREALATVPGIERSDVGIGTARLTLVPGADRDQVRAAVVAAIDEAGYSVGDGPELVSLRGRHPREG